MNVYTDIGEAEYRGLKLSMRRRAVTGVSFSGNYTWAYCFGNRDAAGFLQLNDTFKFNDNPGFDKGNCAGNRTHVGNVTLAYTTPEVNSARDARRGLELAGLRHPPGAVGRLVHRGPRDPRGYPGQRHQEPAGQSDLQ